MTLRNKKGRIKGSAKAVVSVLAEPEMNRQTGGLYVHKHNFTTGT